MYVPVSPPLQNVSQNSRMGLAGIGLLNLSLKKILQEVTFIIIIMADPQQSGDILYVAVK